MLVQVLEAVIMRLLTHAGAMVRRSLLAIACLAMAGVATVCSANAQTAAQINGVWEGENSGNRVTLTMRSGGVDVRRATNNAGQASAPFFFRQSGPWEFSYAFPNGTEAVMRFSDANTHTLTNPDGWTDVFHKISTQEGRAPPPTQQGPTPSPVSAELAINVCNQSAHNVEAAVIYRLDGSWHSEGWFRVNRGQCSVIATADHLSFYLYAAAIDANLVADGSFVHCISRPGPWDDVVSLNSNVCRSGQAPVGFIPETVDNFGTYTWTLN